MVIDKCKPGYIKNRIRISFLWLLIYIVVGVAIFLAGYLWLHTRANVFTVIAVLMVLPGAKRVVNLVVFLPRKSVSEKRVERMMQAADGSVLFTDYVFTSTEKVMHLDFLMIRNGNVLGVVAPSRQDTAYMKKYLADTVHKAAPSYNVRVFDTDEELLKHLKKLSQIEGSETKEKKVEELLHSLAV